jgi:hypothetical protein
MTSFAYRCLGCRVIYRGEPPGFVLTPPKRNGQLFGLPSDPFRVSVCPICGSQYCENMTKEVAA